MRRSHRASLRDATTAPSPELAIPRGRRPVPTHTKMHTRRVPVAMYVLTLLVVPALVVVGFMGAGLWATTGSTTLTTTQTGTSSGENSTAAAASASPADVKGSMTVQQVVDAFPPMTAEQVLAEFGAPLDTPPSTQLKTLAESGSGVDIPALRTWLQEETAP